MKPTPHRVAVASSDKKAVRVLADIDIFLDSIESVARTQQVDRFYDSLRTGTTGNSEISVQHLMNYLPTYWIYIITVNYRQTESIALSRFESEVVGLVKAHSADKLLRRK